VTRAPADGEPWESTVVVSIRNDRDEEIAHQRSGVGVMNPNEWCTFTLSVEAVSAKPEASGRGGMRHWAHPKNLRLPEAIRKFADGHALGPEPGALTGRRSGATGPAAGCPGRTQAEGNAWRDQGLFPAAGCAGRASPPPAHRRPLPSLPPPLLAAGGQRLSRLGRAPPRRGFDGGPRAIRSACPCARGLGAGHSRTRGIATRQSSCHVQSGSNCTW
jgi:hypothetical protein